jgi:hypothetical protein
VCHGEYLVWNTEISEKIQNCTVEILTGNTFNGPTLLAWVTWHYGNKDKFLRGILIIKPTRCTNFSNLFWNRTLHVSDKFSVHHQVSCTVYTAIGICHTVQDSWWWTEYLSETCRVLFQNKFEKLVHFIGFIRIYHDGRSSECQILRGIQVD